jgi:hypothetical protein
MPGKRGEVQRQTPSALSKLSCGHSMLYDPAPREGDIVWCGRCEGYRGFGYTEGWRLVCQSPRCAVARSYGVQEDLCKQRAGRHASRYSHDVGLFWGRDLIFVVMGCNRRYEVVTLKTLDTTATGH